MVSSERMRWVSAWVEYEHSADEEKCREFAKYICKCRAIIRPGDALATVCYSFAQIIFIIFF